MAFPVELASLLTGASLGQLQHWRGSGLLIPEIQRRPKALYSFRDVVALRTVVRLRAEVSLQTVRSAFGTLLEYDLTDHPSAYKLLTDGKSVFFQAPDSDETIDLVKRKGQRVLITMEDVFKPFTNLQGSSVVDFRHPRANLEIREHRLGGWPTVAGTRVRYDTVARLLSDGTIEPSEAQNFYPQVTAAGAIDALDLDLSVRNVRGAA